MMLHDVIWLKKVEDGRFESVVRHFKILNPSRSIMLSTLTLNGFRGL